MSLVRNIVLQDRVELTADADDLLEINQQEPEWAPSPIATINGVDTIKYLEDFAAEQVQGYVEPNADWNLLMASAASDIQSLFSVWEGNALFYPGENITFVFENGTTTDGDDGSKLPWVAEFSAFVDPTNAPNITTGQQLFDFFILGIDSTPGGQATLPTETGEDQPDQASTGDGGDQTEAGDEDTSGGDDSSSSGDSSDASDDDSGSTDADSEAWANPAYPPDPIVSQPDLGTVSGGYVTGYILNDNVTGVLSIPSFFMTADNADTFSTAVRDFLTRSKERGCTRVVIDLQRNIGGSDLLATDTFKQFFPHIDPFNGGRTRAYATNDALGNTFTNYYTSTPPADMKPPFEDLSASVWVAPVYINAETGANFSSWGEYFGPHSTNGDQFTTVQRDNLSSVVFTEQTSGIIVYGFANETVNTTQPYPAKDVLLLTDAYCSSACAHFVDMMKYEGGARTVVAGGRPETGPMQAVGGTRGAQLYSSFDLDTDISIAKDFNSSLTNVPQNRDNLDILLTFAGFNFKDSIRKGDDTPLQFKYLAADCRIYYTTWTIYNYINLWNYVIDALYRNPSLCVAGSTGVNSPPRDLPISIGDMIVAGMSPHNPPNQNVNGNGGYRRRLKRAINSFFSIQEQEEQAQNENQKRSPSPSPEPEPEPQPEPAIPFRPLTPGIETSRLAAPFDLDQCSRSCGPGQICFASPVCKQGKLSEVPSCATRCNVAAGVSCRGPASACNINPGQKWGVCVTPAQQQAASKCGGSKGGSKTVGGVSTKAPNPALKGLQYGRGGRRPGRV